MQWTVHGRRAIYDSPWMSLDLADAEQPDGDLYEQKEPGHQIPPHGTCPARADRRGDGRWNPEPFGILALAGRRPACARALTDPLARYMFR